MPPSVPKATLKRVGWTFIKKKKKKTHLLLLPSYQSIFTCVGHVFPLKIILQKPCQVSGIRSEPTN